MKRASNLSRKFPNPTILVRRYMVSISSDSVTIGSVRIRVATKNVRIIALIIIEDIATFLKSSVFLSNDGRKNKKIRFVNAKIFVMPVIKVLLNPLPKIGNIFSKEKFLYEENRRKNRLINIINIKIAFAPEIARKPNLFKITAGMMKNNNIYMENC